MADYTKAGPAEVNDAITTAAVNNTIDPNIFHAIAMIESSKNPKAVSRSGEHHGLFQMSKELNKHYGITDPYDPYQNAVGAARYMNDNMSILRKAGVPTNATMLYLAHQQGPTGAVQIYNAATKGGTLSQRRYKNMMGNVGKDSGVQTPRDFLAYWDARISKGGKSLSASEAKQVIAKANGTGVVPAGLTGVGGDTTSEGIAASLDGTLGKLAAVDGRTYTPAKRTDTNEGTSQQVIDSKVAQNTPVDTDSSTSNSSNSSATPTKSNEEILLEELKRQTVLLTEIAKTSGVTANVFNGGGLNSMVDNIVNNNSKVQKNYVMAKNADQERYRTESRPAAGTMKIASGNRYA